MAIDTAELRKARGATVGLGGLALAVGLMMLGLGLAGGDGTTAAESWLLQGLLIGAAGSAQIVLGFQLASEEKRTRRNLRILTWMSTAFLVLGAASILAGDYSVVISMLVNALLISYYNKAKHSLVSNSETASAASA